MTKTDSTNTDPRPEKMKMSNVGYQIVGSVQYPNPLDSFLHVVLGVNDFGACVVWTRNDQTGGYSNGQYFTSGDSEANRRNATEYFYQRIMEKF